MTTQSNDGWVRSSHCSTQSCIEVKGYDGRVLIRDSDIGGVSLLVPGTVWAAFIAGVKDGEFDLPEQGVRRTP